MTAMSILAGVLHYALHLSDLAANLLVSGMVLGTPVVWVGWIVVSTLVGDSTRVKARKQAEGLYDASQQLRLSTSVEATPHLGPVPHGEDPVPGSLPAGVMAGVAEPRFD